MFTNGLYGVYASFDKISRNLTSAVDPSSLTGTVNRLTAAQTKAASDKSDLAAQQETLRQQMVSRFASLDTRLSASKSTLSFLQAQISAWNSKAPVADAVSPGSQRSLSPGRFRRARVRRRSATTGGPVPGTVHRLAIARDLCGGARRQCRESAALTRAVSSLLALEMGVDTANPTGPALIQLYQAARRSVLDSAVNFDAERLTTIRADFLEIRQAMLQAARG
jgi:hypothetical protein